MQRFPKPIDHVYILCDPRYEPDRAKYLLSWLQEHQIDPSTISIGAATYKTDPLFQASDIWKLYSPWKRPRTADQFSRNLRIGEVSLVLNFAHVARMAVEAGHKIVLILESDVIFADNFLNRLDACLKSLPSEWDFLSLSAGHCDLRPQRYPHDNNQQRVWFPTANPYFHTRCTDSMIFRVSMLEKVLGTLFPFGETLDWELNYQLSVHKCKSFWLDPPLIHQGKQYATTLL